MSKGSWKILMGLLLALGIMSFVLLTVCAAGGGPAEWPTDTLLDFAQGTMDGVDVWSDAGTARLDHRWLLNVRVNDDLAQGKVYPRLTFVLSNTGTLTETLFLAVWEDERKCDHCPDIYFARSTDGGQNWSANMMVHNMCNPSVPPYPDCACLFTPDIAVRQADKSLWVVWQQDPSYDNIGPDDGDSDYAVSHSKGQTWGAATALCTDTGLQIRPRVISAPSGYLYAVWEDERDDDGDIYIARYNPDVDVGWSIPVKVSDDTTGAEQREPNLAADAAGHVYVVWVDEREDVYGDVYFSRWLEGSSWGASAWSANTRLSDAAMDYADAPDIMAARGSALLAAWMERVPTGPATYDFQIVVARSDDGGATWNRAVVDRLYDASASNAFYDNPALAAGPSETVYVTWLYSPDSQAATSDVLFAQSPDGGTHWTEARTLSLPSGTVSSNALPALASNLQDQLVVAWHDFRDGSSTQIYATGYPANRYLTAGEYRRTLEVSSPATWGHITWTATIPSGAGLVLATRVMPTGGMGWTNWVTHTTSGEAISHPEGLVIQYRASFTSDGDDTPVLDEVVISYETAYQVFLPVLLKGG